MTNLPSRAAGRKGKKLPRKKSIAWRETTPYEQHQPLLASAFDQPSSSSINQPSSSINISTLCGNWSWNWDWDGPCLFGTNLSSSFPTFSQPLGASYPLYYQPPYVPYNPPGLYNSPGAQPLQDMTNHLDSLPLGSSSGMSSLSSYGRGAQLSSHHSQTSTSEPFLVKLLNGRIKICAGCKGPHLKNTNNCVLSPPYHICISHSETQVFVNPRHGTST